ncbi:MAG: phosphate ABC transporter substrate-binding protein [Candidatus Marinimicrobia bacterium]|nr:phosphate ABC transporter substrate-binding protein [Candidatus Neomarinimicrobiota bacterium]
MKLSKVLIGIAIISSLVMAKENNKISIEGSTTVLPIAQIAAEEYMKANPNVDITVRGGGSGVGIASLIEGTCDIADASRSMKDKEMKEAVNKGVNPVAHVVAMDGIAVVIHPSNKLKEISKEQLKAIYTGKYSNWSKLGGAKKKIIVISRDSASGTYEAFSNLTLDGERVRSDALLSASNRAVVTTVENTPGAIGYVGLGYITSKIKAIGVDGVQCTKENILSGEYPLSRPLFMYTNGNPCGQVKAFLDFVKSKEGQKLIEESGYVGLK